MGLIKAGLGALKGTLADQWKEYFYCEAMDKDTMVVKGRKRVGARSSNTKGSDNIISNGSVIAVADGQCMMIVEQGQIVEVCAEPGEFTYDTSTEPSIFSGSLGESILETFKTVGKRFAFGGDTGKDQRVYYFNTKELLEDTTWWSYVDVDPQSGESNWLSSEDVVLTFLADKTGSIQRGEENHSFTWSCLEDGSVCITLESGVNYYLTIYEDGIEDSGMYWMLLTLEERLVWLY